MSFKFNLTIVLYAALALCANPVFADTIDLPAVAELRNGEMKKLIIHSEPKETKKLPFFTEDGTEMTLANYKGKIVVLNFWATWCPPCREEMPSLNALQAELGGEDFEVVTVATGRNSVMGIKKFFAEAGIDKLPILLDQDFSFGRGMGALGLPTTVILDTQGQEIARLLGDADWNSPDAQTVLKAMMPNKDEG